ncbi:MULTISPECIES: GAF domain-containing protein [Nostocales]|uniref:GAF domain-containing protein n=3 Tax=Nostocales TaxID=1161 RepID=A0A0C1QWQ7_9CYAN|nr:GAF domain-containing protein [Tolypothrix bouteillei]KAF3891141.1 GAF domain-containing protein [Tolypothrix bouteillei VB521301]
MQIHSQSEVGPSANTHIEQGLQRVLDRLVRTMHRDEFIRHTTNQLRETLASDRVVLYYFYWQWHGQVTFESLSHNKFSILGSTGADDCFSDKYAGLYLAGRVRAIADIELEPILTCHRDFLRSIQVRANLVVPIVIPRGLWGLLAAHHCQQPRSWSPSDIELMQTAAQTLATDSNILES